MKSDEMPNDAPTVRMRRIVVSTVERILQQFDDRPAQTPEELDALKRALELQKLLDEVETNALERSKLEAETNGFNAVLRLAAMVENNPEIRRAAGFEPGYGLGDVLEGRRLASSVTNIKSVRTPRRSSKPLTSDK
jgi:septum formation inhibitor MinC